MLHQYITESISSATWNNTTTYPHESLNPNTCSRGVHQNKIPRHLQIAKILYKTLFETSAATLDGRLRPNELAALFQLDAPRSFAMKQLVLELAQQQHDLPILTSSISHKQPLPPPPPLQAITSIKSLNYETFFVSFMAKNQPVLVEDLINHWQMKKSSKNGGWLNDTCNKVDIEHLIATYGNETVQCQISPTNNQKQQMTFAEFANEWKKTDLTIPIYLKDWHPFIIPGNENIAGIPNLFQDDWFNEFLPTKRNVDYRFVYLGREGTRTNLHADVMNTYSWSTNVCGRKRWLLLAPEFTHLLYDQFAQKLAPTFHPMYYNSKKVSNDGNDGNSNNSNNNDRQQNWEDKYPLLQFARPIEIIQEVGTSLFVPSGWHHTVENIDDTLSVNSNWCNGNNVAWCFSDLVRSSKGMKTMLPILRWKVEKCIAMLKKEEVWKKEEEEEKEEEKEKKEIIPSTLSPTSSMSTKQLLFIFDLQRAGAVAHSLYCVDDVGIDHFTAMERSEAKGICLMADQALLKLKVPISSDLPLLKS